MMSINKIFINFINSNNKYKYDILWVIFSILLIPISYLIFYYLLGSKMHFGIIIIAIGLAKISVGLIGEKFEPDFGDKRYTAFLKFLSYSTMLFAMFTGIFLLIRDAYENQSVINNFDNDKLNTTISKPRDKNFTNQNDFSPFKSTILDLENKPQKINNDY